MLSIIKKSSTIMIITLASVISLYAESIMATELRLSHFMPVRHTQHKIMETWANKIATISKNQLTITIFPGGTLGKPPQQYDSAVKGITDIAFGLHSYTAGRFPLTSVLQLPFLVKNAEQGSRVAWKLYEKYAYREFSDTKILWMFCHGPGQIHTREKKIRTMENLKGLKLRTPGVMMSKALLKLGAVPVSMPITQVYSALERGTIDGICSPWEIMKPFKLYEQLKYTTQVDIFTQTFFVTMNLAKYNSLPQSLKKIIDNNTGMEMSITAGKAYDNSSMPNRKISIANGIEVYQLPKAEKDRWRDKVAIIRSQWLADMAEKDLPGEQVLSFVLNELK